LLLDHNNNSSQTTNFAIKQPPHHSYNFHDHHHQISHEYGRHLNQNQNQNSKNLVLTSRSNLSSSATTTKSSKTSSSSSSTQGKQTLMNSSGGSSCSSSSINNNNNNNNKKKRIRTSFKHQQLRVMKAHFQINQNPDSKELKELSERTGLQKRVLQVWFQNSRAKQRKTTPTTTSTTNPTLTNPTSMAMAMGGSGSGVGLMSAGLSSLVHSKFHEKDESNSIELDDENFELDESCSSGDNDDADDDDDNDNDDYNFDQEEEDEATNESGNDIDDEEICNKRLRKETDLEREETKQDKKENITKSQVSRGVLKRHKKSLIISANAISPSSSAGGDYILLQHQQQQQHLQQQTQLTVGSSSSSSSSSFGQLSQIHTNFNHQQTPIDFYHCY
jgi:hypothetical protein